MIHAGQVVPEMADHVHRRSREHPEARLILAHCGAATVARTPDAPLLGRQRSAAGGTVR
jgi:hypothetical protein